MSILQRWWDQRRSNDILPLIKYWLKTLTKLIPSNFSNFGSFNFTDQTNAMNYMVSGSFVFKQTSQVMICNLSSWSELICLQKSTNGTQRNIIHLWTSVEVIMVFGWGQHQVLQTWLVTRVSQKKIMSSDFIAHPLNLWYQLKKRPLQKIGAFRNV